jgi:hypothetical protein
VCPFLDKSGGCILWDSELCQYSGHYEYCKEYTKGMIYKLNERVTELERLLQCKEREATA